MQKMSVRWIPIYSAILATFEESWIFWCQKFNSRRQCPDAIWCDMKFFAHYFFRTLRIYYTNMSTSEGGRGGGVCVVSSVEKPRQNTLLNLLVKIHCWNVSHHEAPNAHTGRSGFFFFSVYSFLRLEKITSALSERLAFLYCIIEGPQLRALLKPLSTIALRWSEGLRGASQLGSDDTEGH